MSNRSVLSVRAKDFRKVKMQVFSGGKLQFLISLSLSLFPLVSIKLAMSVRIILNFIVEGRYSIHNAART